MSYYKSLMKSDNVPSQLKRYISVIDAMKARVNKSSSSIKMLLPDLLWITGGNDKSCLELLCCYLEKENFIDFVGESQMITIKLEAPDGARRLSDMFGKISDILMLAGGFRGDFKGMVCVDIQSVKHFNKDFRELMRYIRNETEGCIRVITGDIREHKIKEVEQALVDASYGFQTIRSDALSLDKARIFMKVKLEEYGFTLDSGAKSVVEIMLRQMIDANKLTSLADVDNLCDDLLFYLLGKECGSIISENTVNAYFRQSIMCSTKKKENIRIGFVREEEAVHDAV